ncbi:MAG: LTA synthase family protein [Flavobacteriales bacterium]
MKLTKSVKLILKTYLLVLSIFSVFRLILFFSNIDLLDFDSVAMSTIFKSFLMGLRFDTVVSGYVLFIPALILSVCDIIGKDNKYVNNIMFYWIAVFFSLFFIVAAADIPYFNQFYDRFSVGAFEWLDNYDFVLSMIAHEPKYFLIIIPLILLLGFFLFLLRKIFRTHKPSKPTRLWFRISSSIIILFLIFVGIRGRVQEKSPIRIGTAYFSNNSFFNKLGLNPVFTLTHSYLDNKSSKNAKVLLMDDALAIKNVQDYLGITKTDYSSPIARVANYDSKHTIKPNIVLILMESMSVAKMTRHGNAKNLTPFLYSLSNESIYFDNFYTAGKHTFNGIFSTLCSFPALYRQHPLKNMLRCDGISTTLKENGYSTTYFTTHDSEFDNVGGALRVNNFQNIISQSDYPMSEVKTTLGVPDDYMFRYSIPILNDLARNGQAFFVTFMTASDHGPYYIPDYYKPRTSEIKQQVIEYADWSLNQFISMCSEQAWFDNTIFVFLADHGAAIDTKYDIALNYFHSPLIFYAPKILETDTVYSEIASQIDVFPTLMGILGLPYINNTLGVDLINEKRKYAILNDDDKIGIIDTNYFCLMKNDDVKLYKYRDGDKTDYAAQHPDIARDMTDFAKANMQVFQNMILKRETSLHYDLSKNSTQ